MLDIRNLSDFKDGIPFSALRKQKPSKIPPRGVIIRKKDKLYKSDGKRLTLIE